MVKTFVMDNFQLRASFPLSMLPVLFVMTSVGLMTANAPRRVDRPGYALTGESHSPSPLDVGSPGWDNKRNGCVRAGRQISLISAKGAVETIDFAGAAMIAINRDIFDRRGKWDGAWDQSMMVDTGVVFDSNGTAYTLIIPRYSNLDRAVLLASQNRCRSWRAIKLTGRNATMEKPQTFSDRSGPPTIVSYEYYGSRSGTRLWLERFNSQSNKLKATAGYPKLVANDSRLSANHSGGGNSTLTTKGSIIVVYPSVDKTAKGTQAIAREIDRASGSWIGSPIQIARSTSQANSDAHDTPAIARLPSGKIIVAIGAHHAQFLIYTSNAADTIAEGWNDGEIVGDPTEGPAYQQYSYLSLNISKKGTINIIARAEGDRGRYQLVQLRKPMGGNWLGWPDRKPHRVIATPNRAHYIAWRQKVTEDAFGNIYLHFAFFPNMLTETEARALNLEKSKSKRCHGARCWFDNAPTVGPITLVSHDDGITWK